MSQQLLPLKKNCSFVNVRKTLFSKDMKGKIIIGIRVVLLCVAAFLAFKIYRVIMEPIEWERIQKRRYAQVIDRLEKIREVEKEYKSEYGTFQGDLDALIAFVDTGRVSITERKDSSFMYYNKTYQQDMTKDTVIYRVIGSETVKERLFGGEFDAESLRYIPFSDDQEFFLGTNVIKRNGVNVPVFQAAANNKDIFHDYIAKGEYTYFIDKDYSLEIGSLTEPTLSGNWK